MSDTGAAPAPGGGGKPRSRFNFADLGPRIASAVVLAAAAVGAVVYGGVPFVLFWLAAALAILWEWQRLIGGPQAMARLLVGGAALTLAAAFAAELGGDVGLLVIAVGAGVVAWLAGEGLRWQAAAGVVYAGAMLVAVLALRVGYPYGLLSIAWLFAVVWGTDVMAYFGGRLIGGPKFWPRVSPSKTWSGTLSGVVSGALLGLALAKYASPTPVSWLPVLALGLVTAMVSQAGDFLESALKRRYGVKDSSNLIPGHGGVMDRLDGFITASAFAALVGAARGLPTVSAGLFHWP